jgi:hypothetical protein
MKTIRIILIFLMILLPFGGWYYLFCLYPSQNLGLLYPIPIFLGIGQLLLLFGFVIFLILDRWSELQLALRKEESAKLEKEMEFKKLNLESQLDNAKQRMAHEARWQPDKEIATIIQASKLISKKTSESPQHTQTTVIVKETTEKESIEQEVFDKAIERLSEINATHHKI